MLTLESATRTYSGSVQALGGVSLTCRPGEIIVIVGGSGCGKSTLLRLASGLDLPDSGHVRMDGLALAGPHPAIGLIFQEPRLLPWLTVAANIGFGLADLPPDERRRRVAGALRQVGLADYAEAWPRQLSGGQAQRVAIARALVARPSVLLLDEPFSALDPFTRADLQDHLLDLWRDSRPTLVIVTHDVEEAVVLADRVIVMRPRPGRIAAEVTVDLARPRDRLSPEFEAVRHRILGCLDQYRLHRPPGEETSPAAAI